MSSDSQHSRKHPDLWVDPEDDPRNTGAVSRGERAVLEDYLDHYRKTLELKCEGLDPDQLARRSVPPSTMTFAPPLRFGACPPLLSIPFFAPPLGRSSLAPSTAERDGSGARHTPSSRTSALRTLGACPPL